MGSQPAKHLLLIFNSSDHPGGNSFFQGKLNYTSMRCLNFLEEKLYLWSSRKKFLWKQFPKVLPQLEFRKELQKRFLSSFPFPYFLLFFKKFYSTGTNLILSSILSLASLRGGGEVKEGSFGIKSVCQAFNEITCFLPSLLKSLSFETRVYELGDERIHNYIPLGQYFLWSSRMERIFKPGLQMLVCVGSILRCYKRSHDAFRQRLKCPWCFGCHFLV